MNRINQLLQDRTKPVLSIYYPAGYPNYRSAYFTTERY